MPKQAAQTAKTAASKKAAASKAAAPATKRTHTRRKPVTNPAPAGTSAWYRNECIIALRSQAAGSDDNIVTGNLPTMLKPVVPTVAQRQLSTLVRDLRDWGYIEKLDDRGLRHRVDMEQSLLEPEDVLKLRAAAPTRTARSTVTRTSITEEELQQLRDQITTLTAENAQLTTRVTELEEQLSETNASVVDLDEVRIRKSSALTDAENQVRRLTEALVAKETLIGMLDGWTSRTGEMLNGALNELNAIHDAAQPTPRTNGDSSS